ncbi:MAG: solute carrier family 10 (sodium/bile acid cotransporter), er 7 [Pseudonocardiales bacterium]|nr:solute carrier family 10 (sodium/bile acid cotransporter), er 7 [Pseudonocardiales bacterium]
MGKHRRPTAGARPSRLGNVLAKLRLDLYVLCLLGTVGVASILPARGSSAVVLTHATTIAIGFLFFLYGARLSSREALDGLRQWRLHAVVLASTYFLFPLLGLAARLLVPTVLTPELYAGLMFLCCLPSTVQSSIAFTSIARGNVAAAICSASFSNILGIVLTPVLVAVFLVTRYGGISWGSVRDIMLQLMVPFLAGQLLRRWIGAFLARHKKVLGLVDRGSILLVVYTAFSEGVVAGIWSRLTPVSLLLLVGTNVVLLALVLGVTTWSARNYGFGREDEIVIVFCGSKKSLASGIPMATVLFSAQTVGLVVLPLMLFHQIQLMTCAWLARRYAARAVQLAPTEAGATI